MGPSKKALLERIVALEKEVAVLTAQVELLCQFFVPKPPSTGSAVLRPRRRREGTAAAFEE